MHLTLIFLGNSVFLGIVSFLMLRRTNTVFYCISWSGQRDPADK